jgi:putative transcriptional regulator
LQRVNEALAKIHLADHAPMAYNDNHSRSIEASAQDYRGGTLMDEELFAELEASLKEGMAILHGEAQPSRTFVFEPPDVKAIREDLHFTQQQFAGLLGISVRTLQNWEQGRRAPQGPARVLLMVAAKHPKAVLDTVRMG